MASGGDTSASVKFSTGRLPLREGLAAYRQMLDRSVGNFAVTAIGDHFEFSTNSFALPGLGIAQITSSALRIERTREMTIDATRDLVFAVVHDGSASRHQRGREVLVKGSGAFLSSSHIPLVTQRTAARLTNYSLLGSNLAPAISSLDRAMLTTIPVNSEPIRLLTAYTNLLFANDVTALPESRRLAVSHIHDLIALAIGATRDAAETAKACGLRGAPNFTRALAGLSLCGLMTRTLRPAKSRIGSGSHCVSCKRSSPSAARPSCDVSGTSE